MPGRTPPQKPPTFKHDAKTVLEDTNKLIEQSRALQDKLVRDIKPEDATFENVILPLAGDENDFRYSSILSFYQSVSTNKELRDASGDAKKLISEFSIESSMREDVFKLVHAVAQNMPTDLDPESKRLVERMDRDFIRNGLLLDEEKREKYKEMSKELSNIRIAFQKNVNEENGGLWLTKEELHGLPQDTLNNLKTEERDGEQKYFLSWRYPDLFPALKYVTNVDIRKKILIGNETKVPQNLELFDKGIRLRAEMATMMGFDNHAAYSLDIKMAKNPKIVNDFLADLRVKLQRGGEEEMKRLKQLKREDMESRGEVFDGTYALWDHRFYDRLLTEKEYQVDDLKIAEYFPLDKAIKGMFDIFENSFGLEFVKISDQGEIGDGSRGWHEDCIVHEVWNSEDMGGDFVGYLYIDCLTRESKYGHAAKFNLLPGFLKDPKDPQSRHYPCAALVCNFSKPTATKPSLLKHDELVTLFHELGHGIHDLVSRTIYSRFHGTSVVRDFVEAPSQMLENWCWEPEQLRKFSSHYDTKEPLPEDLIQKLVASKHVNAATFYLRQLFFGIFDMHVHTIQLPKDETLNSTVLYNSLRREICGFEGMDDDTVGQGQTSFGHLFGGYAAGYYGYLWSEVFSQDMFFTAFKKDPMNKEAGRRYRKVVLERGGSLDEMENLKEFLGREPNSDAFLEELGLKN
ncbi:Saccharolysin [Arthrobotrys entomopaga]|nr:Saccharolysin [Arthrobotrys entomopaga]